MREDEYLQSLHFNCLRIKDGSAVNMSLRIVLAIDDEVKERIGVSKDVAVIGPNDDLVGILRRNQGTVLSFCSSYGKEILEDTRAR
ncbi:ATP sulfurylase 2 [Olea europaea subsp. europaea]|uniref:ATP sulfurylase 2 n=1 Tax=Olea europaea subsp. europaea TaxID=158383 RepID=A0A8S0QUV0_OLEEU|nr:ATP sulfurylase 2 [Olea europaea subsp. europaea]